MTARESSDQAQTRLRKIVALFDSQEEGEALAALRQARRLLRDSGGSFRDLLQPAGTQPPQAADSLMVTSLKAYADDLKTRLSEAQAAAEAWREKAESRGREQSAALAAAEQRIAALKARAGAQAAEQETRIKAMRRELLRAEAIKLKAVQDQAEMWRRRAEGQAAAPKIEASAGMPPAAVQQAAPRRVPQECAPQHEDLRARVAALEKALAAASRRGNAEKRAEVQRLLRDPLTARLADREIARQAGVSPQTVSNWRRRLRDMEGMPAPSQRLVCRKGRSYAMRTAKIGRVAQGAGAAL